MLLLNLLQYCIKYAQEPAKKKKLHYLFSAFERLFNVENGREAVISTVGMRGSKVERGWEDERV